MAQVQNVYNVTLSSKRVVVLREYKLKHQENAAMAVASRCNDSPLVMAVLMPKEIMKQLIISVDGKAPKLNDMEDIESVFSTSEMRELLSVLKQLMGGDEKDAPKPQIEFVTSGDKLPG